MGERCTCSVTEPGSLSVSHTTSPSISLLSAHHLRVVSTGRPVWGPCLPLPCLSATNNIPSPCPCCIVYPYPCLLKSFAIKSFDLPAPGSSSSASSHASPQAQVFPLESFPSYPSPPPSSPPLVFSCLVLFQVLPHGFQDWFSLWLPVGAGRFLQLVLIEWQLR